MMLLSFLDFVPRASGIQVPRLPPEARSGPDAIFIELKCRIVGLFPDFETREIVGKGGGAGLSIGLSESLE